MFYFDTHIHIQDFKDNHIFDKIENAKIVKCICVSAKQTDWEKVAYIYEKHTNVVIPSFGLHPWYISDKTADWAKKLEYYLNKFQCALIGECGFDSLKNDNYEMQKDVFLTQVYLAKKYNRALLLHAVKAHKWLSDIWNELPPKFVFHSFNSRIDLLKKVLDCNGYIALNKKILNNKQAREIILNVPMNKMLIESDAPYQSNINDLSYLVEKISFIKEEKIEDVINALYTNAMEIVNNDK